MATRQAVGRWAAVLAAAVLLGAPGCSSEPGAPTPIQKAEAPAAKELDLGGGVTMKLALIPAGKFMMGEGKAPHEVTISKPFYMGATEVTQAQYEAIMGTNPSRFKGTANPVETVFWNDATEFCKKLSEKTRQAVRLPTEAEWEYACRAGTKTRFSFGGAHEGLADYAWYSANSGNTTYPVGQKKPNAWGLYDMHGNVWEWCADWFGDYPKGAVTDPQGPASAPNRVLRGGSWGDHPRLCRSASRYRLDPGYRGHSLGFRVVVSVPGLPAAAVPVAAQPAPAAPTAAAPADLTLDLGGGVTMKLALIPAGKFMMGSPDSEQGRSKDEGPQHEVTLSKPFYMGVTEVTQAQYEAVMGTNPSKFKGATNPVEKFLRRNDALEFCKKLSEKSRQTVRLPTEAEWEYACRAGTQTAFSFGDDPSALGDYAWWGMNSGETTHPVGQKKPNAWGLYDMHGNVLEWCADLYGEYSKDPVTDPSGSAARFGHLVARGGPWGRLDAGAFRCASRRYIGPMYCYDSFGFRVVVSVSAPGL